MRFPVHGWVGLALIALVWPLNWGLSGLRTHLLFFPLWLGYCLLVDGLVLRRDGDSLLSRSWSRYLGLFLVSAPAWWLFEAINLRTANWVYLGRERFSDSEYAVLATIAFSTVIPAVFGTAELLRGSAALTGMRTSRPLLASPSAPTAMLVTGVLMLALLLRWPRLFFALVWLALWLILEPLNHWLGHRTLLAPLRRGDRRPLVALAGGALVCGFFWELWNWHSYPKWTYEVPFVGFLRVFEMPLLGYGGYLPFALELFAIYHLVTGLLGTRRGSYLRL